MAEEHSIGDTVKPTPQRQRHPLTLAALATLASAAAHAQQAGTDAVAAPVVQRVEIIGVTPVPGTGERKDQIPANVQTANARRLRELQSLNLPDFLGSQLPSVNVNEMQGNPFQMDVNYRGFSASPLLGTPQGLSVFQDGVRINEPFGDVVNWDLVPLSAISEIALVPGANPLFGLNTLGGALTLQTKSGDTDPGTELELSAGSFGRIATGVSHGRTLGQHGHLFVAASSFDEDGWRDHSPSRVRQLFAKGGVRESGREWALSLTHGHNRLVGNGAAPESMLAQRRAQVYTVPDVTENTMTMLSLNGRIDLSAQHQLAATLYVRDGRVDTLNGDLNDDYDPPEVEEAGVENRTRTRQRAAGGAIQSTWTSERDRYTLGASFDQSRSNFRQSEAEGELDDRRGVVPTEEAEVNAQIAGRSRTASLYAHGLFTLAPALQLTVSARYNDTDVETVDEGRIKLGLPTTLDGQGRYRKLNPAAGLTWQVAPTLTAYGSVGQGSRAPSPIELGCSDPEHPCVLPNALQSDPPLKQVVSQTVEAGVRGSFGEQGRWNATLYSSVNRDDLLFISNGRAAGYFANVGRTRRQGVELHADQRAGALYWAASYSYLRATYDTTACLVAEANSSAETSTACPGEGEIEVRPGDRLPGLPGHSVKLAVDWQASLAWALGLQLRAFSGQTVRGNENNAHRPDGEQFHGSGRIGGFAVVDMTASWKPWAGVEIFGKVSNLFDRRYATAGLLGENAFDGSGALLPPGEWRTAQFVAPGAPRAGWVGARLDF
jgi:outer membrane receptor protein involved in Fe transport